MLQFKPILQLKCTELNSVIDVDTCLGFTAFPQNISLPVAGFVGSSGKLKPFIMTGLYSGHASGLEAEECCKGWEVMY